MQEITHQFLVQLLGVAVVGVYAFVISYVALKAINLFTAVRVSDKEQIEGLDVCLHGEVAYAPVGVFEQVGITEAEPLMPWTATVRPVLRCLDAARPLAYNISVVPR